LAPSGRRDGGLASDRQRHHLAQGKVRKGGQADVQFVLSPTTLSPFFGGNHLQDMWRQTVLDALTFVPNIVVLAESTCEHLVLDHELKADGFSAAILRRTVVEFASPPFDQPPPSPIPFIPRTVVLPKIDFARKESTSHWAKSAGEITEVSTTEQVDRLINFVPHSSGAKW